MEDIKEKTADERIARLIKKCDECKMNECIGCEICWGDVQEIAELIEEKERYKYLYKKALSNTIMSDRELFRVKEENEQLKNEGIQKWLKEVKDCIPISVIQNKIEWFKVIADNGMNAVRFACSKEDEIQRIERQKNISTMIGILQELLEERNK